MGPIELTLAILKPHIIKHPISLESIQRIILASNFKIVKSMRKSITIREAEDFYVEHKNKFFFNRLVTFMTSGSSEFYILAKENAIKDWRRLMGPTKVYRAQFEAPDTIRGKFGLSDTRNAAHGSDSPESAKREIAIFFPEFDVDKWFREEEPLFRNNKVLFSKKLFIHETIS